MARTPAELITRSILPSDPFHKAEDLKAAPVLDSAVLGSIVSTDPSLWKGAEIYRFRHLPHHLRVTVLAAARAGIVTSAISAVTQQDFHYRIPEGLQGYAKLPIESPTWSLRSSAGGVPGVEVRFQALSYADLMEKDTFATWIRAPKDVAHWPDPGVVYIVVRSSAGEKNTIEEEEAEIQAIPNGTYMLRARGPFLKPAKEAPVVVSSQAGNLMPRYPTCRHGRRSEIVDPPPGSRHPETAEACPASVRPGGRHSPAAVP